MTAPNAAQTAFLNVTCVSSTDCWGVGDYFQYDGTNFRPGHPMTEHWNGVAWSVVPAVDAATTFSAGKGTLESVACASATFCFAVGEYQNNSGVQQGLIERWDGNSWSIVAPNTSTTQSNYLDAVTCNSATDCWAGGANNPGSGYQTLLLHWNGTAWSIVSSPNAPNSTSDGLAEITCLATNNCWAVGSFANTVPANQTLVEHWDGTSWSIIASPNVSVTEDSVFQSISCASASDCWATGAFLSSGVYGTLTEHWNGTAWSIVSSPNSSASEHNILYRVRCNAASDCLAVGYRIDTTTSLSQTLTEHWNGTAWSIISSPNASPDNQIYGLACGAASDCWAVGGFTGANVGQILTLRWNGSAWSLPSSTNVGISNPSGDNSFNAVTCINALDCWAVGGAAQQTLTAHWNGRAWFIISSPNTSVMQPNQLNALTCPSTSDCWAVGYYQNGSNIPQTLTEHWNGSAWSLVSSPNTDVSQNNTLNGVACISANDCSAVGSFVNNNGVHQTLVLRWNGSAWSIVTSPNSAVNQDNQLAGATCVASECWAVGNYKPGTVTQVLIEKWDGNTWTIFPSTNTSTAQNNSLSGVSCFAASQCIGVGTFINGSTNRTLVEQWTSLSSSIVSSPNSDSTHNNSLGGIHCTSASNCAAVGQFVNASNIQQPLIEQWDGSVWTIAPPNSNSSVNSFLTGVSCVSSANCWSAGTRKPGTVLQTMLEEFASARPPLGSLSSRLAHGTLGNFDVDLPQSPGRGTECRNSPGSNYTLVFNFSNNLTTVGTVTSSGTGSIVGSSMGPFPNQYTVNITGLTNTNNFTATLSNVTDAEGNSGNISGTIYVLQGDTTGNGVVNSSDIAQAQSQSGQPVTSSNCREDVTINGSINSSDIAFVQSKSGTGLP